MATIADNILDLAMLVKDVKRKTQLSETTIMRVVDMSFALAQQNQTPNFGPEVDPDFTFPTADDVIDHVIGDDNVIEFPTTETTEEN